jgi:putative transposase
MPPPYSDYFQQRKVHTMAKSEHPNRKLPRLKGYDYAQEGAYFVTICTHKREHIFGDVVGDEMRLSAAGQVAESCWQGIPSHFPHVELDFFVVMPNHVHGIVVIVKNINHDTNVGRGHAPSLPEATPARPKTVQPGSLGAIMGSYKSAVTRAINQMLGIKAPIVWQESYYDRIIRNERQLHFIRNYVLTNPAHWAEDQYFKERQ